MANVSMPENGVEFLTFVKGSPGENKKLSFYPTYAHLLCAAAALGLSRDNYIETPTLLKKDPLPIPWETFQSQGLKNYLLIMIIQYLDEVDAVRDTDRVCETIQGLAAGGFQEMSDEYNACGSADYWGGAWEKLILEVGRHAAEQSPSNSRG